MRTLILNKFLHRNGGSETYIFKLGEALEQHGHEVQYFGIDRDEVAEHIEKFIPITKKDHLIEWSKKIIYRVGIYRFLKKKMS